MLKLFLWLRYLRKKKIVFLSIAAVALSVSLLMVVASLFTGFIDALRQTAVETVGDVVLSPPIKFTKYELLIQRLEQMAPVEAATATLSAPSLLHLGKGNVRAVNVWGIEPARRAKVTGFKKFLRRQGQSNEEPSFDVPGFPEGVGGFVGIAVVAEPDEKTDEYDFAAIEKMIGEQVVLTTGAVPAAQEFESAGAQVKRRTLKFTIVDIVFTGVYELDKKFVYLPIEELQEKLYPNGNGRVADQIQIKLSPGTRADVAIAQIRGLWQNFVDEQLEGDPYLRNYTDIETAEQMQNRYIAELRKQMGVLLLIFGVVSFGVVVLIFCIF
jgi:ABC-type lipoprotein release transport system permease subunit